MVITKRDLVVLLNMDLELEYATAVQYAVHASLIIRSPHYHTVAKEIILDAEEDFQHGILLACQITQLGGCPSTNIARVYACSDEEQMLLRDLEDVRDAICRYVVRIEQAYELGEHDLAQKLEWVLGMEREHEADFQCHQTLRKRQRQKLIPEMVEDDTFTERWQQRAMNVPVRIRLKDFLDDTQ